MVKIRDPGFFISISFMERVARHKRYSANKYRKSIAFLGIDIKVVHPGRHSMCLMLCACPPKLEASAEINTGKASLFSV